MSTVNEYVKMTVPGYVVIYMCVWYMSLGMCLYIYTHTQI